MKDELDPCSEKELAIRENFKKDYKLSCPVLDDNDIFAKSLVIAELVEEWNDYYEMALRIGLDGFNDYRNNLRNQIVSFISAVKGFQELNEIDNSKLQYTKGPKYMCDESVGKRLVSIDLVRGNYQSLKYLGANFVLDSEKYEDIVSKFTKEKCLINSKHFRQMVFGLLKPNVQSSVQLMMMNQIIDQIYQIKKFPLMHLTNDEVIFEIKNDKDLEKIHKAVKNIPYDFRVEEFRLAKILNKRNEPWYVKYMIDTEKRRIMGVHVRYLFQVYNYLEKEAYQVKDFWWREQGRLSALLEPEEFSGLAVESLNK